jgi:hypothetical protein
MSISDTNLDTRPAFSTLSHADLVLLCETLYDQNVQLRALVAQLTERVAELERQLKQGGSGDPPSFVKANVPNPREKSPRKQRSQPAFRPLDKPTSFVQHAPECCPDCGRTLSGGWVHRTRQSIEIPPCPVQITEHQIAARWCGVCRKRVLPSASALSTTVLGRHRVGLNLMSWIGTLHILARVPLRTIQKLLRLLFGLHLGLGELTEVLHTLADKGQSLYEKMVEHVRGSPVVHADESGWREDGQNGYIWSFSTPSTRCFVYNKSRSGQVAEEVLGERFGMDVDTPQVLVSDFYGGYNRFLCRHQRCWVHLLRDLHKLQEVAPEEARAAVTEFVARIRAVYDNAREYQRRCLAGDGFDCGPFDRQRKRKEFESEIRAIAGPYAPLKGRAPVAQTTLAGRMTKFLGELFTFVEFPDAPSENNAAERSIRPAVIARKISGGTRSAKGSQTQMILMSLLGTWNIQNKNPLKEIRQMLETTTSTS